MIASDEPVTGRPVDGSIAVSTHVAMLVVGSMPAVTSRMNPSDLVKRQLPVNDARPAGSWRVCPSSWILPSWNERGSRFASSCSRTWIFDSGPCALAGVLKLIVYGSGVATGTKLDVPEPLGPVIATLWLATPVMPKKSAKFVLGTFTGEANCSTPTWILNASKCVG